MREVFIYTLTLCACGKYVYSFCLLQIGYFAYGSLVNEMFNLIMSHLDKQQLNG